jgi:hypothetical protein
VSQPFDGFNDVIEGTTGVLGGAGIQAYEQVRRQYTAQGLRVEVHCASCGYPRHLDVSWPELIAIKCDINPAAAYGRQQNLRQFADDWASTAQQSGRGVSYAWYPSGLRCRCSADFKRPLISPSECESHLSEMRRMGAMPRQTEGQLMQHCMAMRGGGARR